VSISVVKCSWVKCGEVLQCSGVLLVLLFIAVYMVVCFVFFLFNSVSYVFSLLCLCILIVMYVLFCIFCFHCVNWDSPATLTEVSPCIFLGCKANAKVLLAKYKDV
jgi:hypothetical protein